MVYISIKNCNDCTKLKKERVYTPDSFEMVFKWVCTKNKKVIKGGVGTFDKDPEIQKWCPLLLKASKKNDLS